MLEMALAGWEKPPEFHYSILNYRIRTVTIEEIADG